jgi:hypothetical protein
VQLLVESKEWFRSFRRDDSLGRGVRRTVLRRRHAEVKACGSLFIILVQVTHEASQSKKSHIVRPT